MKWTKVRLGMLLFASVAASVLITLVVERRHSAASRAERQRVPWSEIGRGSKIVGEFGKPLGEMVTIRGRWLYPPGFEGPTKDDDPVEFVVDEIDGARLDTPVRINRYRLSYLEDYRPEADPLKRTRSVIWELRGFERGGYSSAPPAAYEEFKQAYGQQMISPQMPADGRHGFGFYCWFVYITAHPTDPAVAK